MNVVYVWSAGTNSFFGYAGNVLSEGEAIRIRFVNYDRQRPSSLFRRIVGSRNGKGRFSI